MSSTNDKNIIQKNKWESRIKELEERITFLETENFKNTYIINKIDIGLLFLNYHGEIRLINSVLSGYLQKYFNYDPQIGANVQDFPSNVLTDAIRSCYEKFDNGSNIIELPNELHIKVTSDVMIIKESGKKYPFFMLIEFHDVSNFVKFDKMRTAFTSMVSHELRAPISTIDLSIKNMVKYNQDITPEIREKLESLILTNSDLMNEIVNDLLLVSHLDEEKLQVHYELFDLSKAIDDVIFQLDEKRHVKDIEIKKIVMENQIVETDRLRIEQVIRIILDNAIKYSNSKGLIIIDTTVNGDQYEKGEVIVSIQDFGRGIREEEMNKLFQRFFRSKDVQHIRGTGLGLAIAKELIELLGGMIEVTSQIGTGSTFKIIFPIKKR